MSSIDMTSASFDTIERYYARTLPIISDISRTNGLIRTNFFFEKITEFYF